MNYIKAKYPNSTRSYTYKTVDSVKVGDTVVTEKGAKLIAAGEVNMAWVEAYGADKLSIVKKYEEPVYKTENDRYIIERVFEHTGYTCVVTFGNMGHRYGYVGIPSNHPLFGKDYNDYLEIKKSDIGDREVSGIFPLLGACLDEDERIRIEAYFQCHGGITFADGGENSNYPIESDLWWFGFDCAHCDDAKELELAYERFPNYRKSLAMQIECEDRFHIDGLIIRTEKYVAEECKKLAEQLKEFEPTAVGESEE